MHNFTKHTACEKLSKFGISVLLQGLAKTSHQTSCKKAEEACLFAPLH